MITAKELEKLDPGIRKVVAWLDHLGFTTTDSGDGVTKLTGAWTDDEVLDEPHVFMMVEPDKMVSESYRLFDRIERMGLQDKAIIEAIYNPKDGAAIIALRGISDEDLK